MHIQSIMVVTLLSLITINASPPPVLNNVSHYERSIIQPKPLKPGVLMQTILHQQSFSSRAEGQSVIEIASPKIILSAHQQSPVDLEQGDHPSRAEGQPYVASTPKPKSHRRCYAIICCTGIGIFGTIVWMFVDTYNKFDSTSSNYNSFNITSVNQNLP